MHDFHDTLYIRRYIQAIIQLTCFSLTAMAPGFCRFARVKVRSSDREVTRFISHWLAATVGDKTLFRRSAQSSPIIVYVMFT